jgi:hypothetical protein
MGILLLLICLPAGLAAQEEGAAEEGGPGYGGTMLVEALLPGSGLIRLGRACEGGLAMALSLPMMALGQGMRWYHFLYAQGGLEAALGKGYAFDAGSADPQAEWLLGVGSLLDSGGRAVAAYSAMTTHLFLLELGGSAPGLSDRPAARPLESPSELILSPFGPEALSVDVLPLVILLLASSLPQDAPERLQGFFAEPGQPFWGQSWKPWAALVWKAVSAALESLAGAIGQEILYGRLIAERDGHLVAAVARGGRALLSLGLPRREYLDPALKAAGASCLGLYASALSASEGGSLRKPVAFHFWLEFGRSVMGYLMDPEADEALGMGFEIGY